MTLSALVAGALALACWFAGPASAQSIYAPPGFSLVPADPLPNYDDGTDIGRAMAICAAHEMPSNRVLTVVPPRPADGDYPQDWQGCYQVRSIWRRSEAGRQEQAHREQLARDKAFVDDVARRHAD